MGAGFSTGNVVANISGSVTTSAPTLPTGATQVCGNGSASNSTGTVYTVTAGKTLYITGITMSGAVNGAASNSAILKADLTGTGPVEIARLFLYGTATVNGTGELSLSPCIPIQVPATKTVTITTSLAACTCVATIVGYEV